MGGGISVTSFDLFALIHALYGAVAMEGSDRFPVELIKLSFPAEQVPFLQPIESGRPAVGDRIFLIIPNPEGLRPQGEYFMSTEQERKDVLLVDGHTAGVFDNWIRRIVTRRTSQAIVSKERPLRYPARRTLGCSRLSLVRPARSGRRSIFHQGDRPGRIRRRFVGHLIGQHRKTGAPLQLDDIDAAPVADYGDRRARFTIKLIRIKKGSYVAGEVEHGVKTGCPEPGWRMKKLVSEEADLCNHTSARA